MGSIRCGFRLKRQRLWGQRGAIVINAEAGAYAYEQSATEAAFSRSAIDRNRSRQTEEAGGPLLRR